MGRAELLTKRAFFHLPEASPSLSGRGVQRALPSQGRGSAAIASTHLKPPSVSPEPTTNHHIQDRIVEICQASAAKAGVAIDRIEARRPDEPMPLRPDAISSSRLSS
jgi:hypothetical protein